MPEPRPWGLGRTCVLGPRGQPPASILFNKYSIKPPCSTYLHAHRLMHVLIPVKEASLCSRCWLTQRHLHTQLVSEQRQWDLGMLSHKQEAINGTSLPLKARDHDGRGGRTFVGARDSGQLEWRCFPGTAEPLHTWIHSSHNWQCQARKKPGMDGTGDRGVSPLSEKMLQLMANRRVIFLQLLEATHIPVDGPKSMHTLTAPSALSGFYFILSTWSWEIKVMRWRIEEEIERRRGLAKTPYIHRCNSQTTIDT